MNRGAGLWKLLVLLLLCCLPSLGSTRVTVDVGRGPVTVEVPDNYDPAVAMPLIVLLHGYTSTGAEAEAYLGLGALVDSFGFIYTYPDGEVNSAGENFWNGGAACCDFDNSGVDDVAYLSGLIAALGELYNLDQRRIHFMGHSNGGFMAYRMACERAEMVASIASLAGSTVANATLCNPGEPVHVLQIHGTNDGTILYNGGFIGFTPYPGAVETVARWAAYNGCSDQPEQLANIDLEFLLPGNETVVTRYSGGCMAGGSAELWSIVAGGHVPFISADFATLTVAWLLDHAKAGASAELDGPLYYLPHIASDWDNLILVDNLDNSPGQFSLELYDETGTFLVETSHHPAAGSFLKVDPATLAEGAASARIRTDRTDMNFRIAYIHPTQGGTAELALGSDAYSRLFFNFGVYDEDVLPLTFKGLAVYNPHDASARVTFEALDDTGAVLASVTTDLPAKTRMRAVLEALFSFPEGVGFARVARVTAVSDQTLVGLNLSGVSGSRLLFGPAIGRD